MRLKLEYDTTYPDKLNTNKLNVDSRFNIGLITFSDSLNLGAAFERGNQFRVSFVLRGNFMKDTIPKPKPRNVISLTDQQKRIAFDDKGIFYRSLNRSLRDESIFIQAASYKDNEVDISIASNRFQSIIRPIGRTARIVSALAVNEVDTINIHSMNGDLEIAKVSLNRKEFDLANRSVGSTAEVLNKSVISSTSDSPLYRNADFIPKVNFPR